MKTKEIYLIRHGQTQYNLLGIVQGGGVDTDLNDRGRRQAEAFYRAYGHIAFDKVYTSTLKRAIQSVQGFIDRGTPWERHAGLNEMSWGVREGTRINPEEDAYYYDTLRRWNVANLDDYGPAGSRAGVASNRQSKPCATSRACSGWSLASRGCTTPLPHWA